MSNIGLVGRKCGMTRIFDESGASTPVTVIQVLPNKVTQIKTEGSDQYSAIQVTMGNKKASSINNAQKGHFSKANVEPGVGLWEFRVNAKDLEGVSLGAEFTVNQFEAGQWVDVTGTTRGRGFSGTIKRHNFSGQRNSHGNSLSHRAPGSIGQCQTPGRVFKGKKMAGQYGNEQVTIQSLKLVKVDPERQVLLIKGAVPGAPGGIVIVKAAVKKTDSSAA